VKLHGLLTKQLERAGIATEPESGPWAALLQRVSQAYVDADLGRYRLERSITISAEEMSELAHSLAGERDRIRAIFDSAAVGITQASLDGTLLECNNGFAGMVGRRREEILGRPWLDFVHPEERANTWARSSQVLDQPLTFDRRYVHADGSTVWATVTVSTVRGAEGEPLWNISVQRDITAQRELEVSLRHAQKLEAVGRLAAGVAHEINTPLQFVGDNLDFLKTSVTALLEVYDRVRSLVPAAQSEEVARIEEDHDLEFLRQEAAQATSSSVRGVEHVAHIVRAMKVLAHHDDSTAPALVDINGMLDSVVMLARSETKYVADVSLELGDVPRVMGFANDLSQVFLNLVVNAAHAVGDNQKGTRRRGKIEIRSAQESAAHVIVTIADSGCGIPEAIRSRVFEPFFTTKEVGRGTGQGLSLARAIVVDKHCGELTFDSELGRGTTFVVRLRVDGPSRRAG
jgi:PAS domain S-box-containing protein